MIMYQEFMSICKKVNKMLNINMFKNNVHHFMPNSYSNNWQN